MTAEVAILNREAVAIAADSAVTLTEPEGRKIYNTANKLAFKSKPKPSQKIKVQTVIEPEGG